MLTSPTAAAASASTVSVLSRRLDKTKKASAASGMLRVEPRSLALVLLIVAVVLVPWTALLAVGLPSSHVSRHWNVAWAGFDIELTAVIPGTAVAVWRRSRLAPFAATATATLLGADA
jgi:hypothetical protein